MPEEESLAPLPDYRTEVPAEKPASDPAQLRAQAKELDDAHHAEATMHLSDESLLRGGIRQPAFRPVVDEKTGAHTGELKATPVPEVHG